MKVKDFTEKQKQAYNWWCNLSINEMKAYAKKYFSVLWDQAYIYNNISYIESIFESEHKEIGVNK